MSGIALMLISLLSVPSASDVWPSERYERILAGISTPEFRSDTVWIEVGSTTDDINESIERCSANGGGVVAFRPGVFHTAGIVLRSNVNLHLGEETILEFSGNVQDYLPPVRTRWEGMDCMNYRPLIYACGETDIAITGGGVIDGGAGNENWWWMKGRKEFGYTKGMPSQNNTGRPLLMRYNNESVPLEKRIMGEGMCLRPQLINIIDSRNVLIQGVTIKNSPFWVIHPLFCSSFTMRGVTVSSFGPNNDGCDPESCNGVLIEDCTFYTGDDCIALKSGRNNDGRRSGVPSRNIIIRRCHFAAGHGGVTVGSEISGGLEGLFAEDCSFDGEDLRHALRFKSSRVRGGEIRDVFVRNFNVARCSRSCIDVDLQYEAGEETDAYYEPRVCNVRISGFRVGTCRSFLNIKGTGEDGCVSNFMVGECRVESYDEKYNFDGAQPDNLYKMTFGK